MYKNLMLIIILQLIILHSLGVSVLVKKRIHTPHTIGQHFLFRWICSYVLKITCVAVLSSADLCVNIAPWPTLRLNGSNLDYLAKQDIFYGFDSHILTKCLIRFVKLSQEE